MDPKDFGIKRGGRQGIAPVALERRTVPNSLIEQFRYEKLFKKLTN